MSNSHITSKILMVRPDYFGFNSETAGSNYFQNKPKFALRQVRKQVMAEFNGMVNKLLEEKIEVFVLSSRENTNTPDSVFPNNWFSMHSGGKLIIYPMLAVNRRNERQADKLIEFLNSKGIVASKVLDLSPYEKNDQILEGTGSLILDRVSKIAFAMESPRATKSLFKKWCILMGYEGVFFHAYDKNNLPIYHTNVLMSIGDRFAVYCEDAISDSKEKAILRKKFSETKKELILITIEQVYSFCGNILQVESTDGKKKIVMSRKAFNSFTNLQKSKLEKHGKLVPVDIFTIETIGGGSARCMMAEVFT